ncbi:MAG: hypothetical protein Q9181_002562 [Wetmoreana brouardii]
MDPAIAALVVALAALFVALAQAIQQYLVSGQLIRLCDSVVYNQMPGQGHRIWQFSQFRFRVVYSIPQIRLLPEVWLSLATPAPSLSPDAIRLPQLSVKKSKASISALAGEASWVSFIRAVQYSSGGSLRYTMLEGDADRCPSDLPVVPMQLSMRDVIVLGIMTGMECTDVSFRAQTISMQGDAGTITSSRHPVLGALVHFAPKQNFESQGIQAQHGTINPNWVARLMDVVTVAGQRYDLRERKQFEEDEGSWLKATNDRAQIQEDTPDSAKALYQSCTVRQRRPNQKLTLENKVAELRIGDQHNSVVQMQCNPLNMRLSSATARRPQDGEWYFVSAVDEPSASDIYNKTLVLTEPTATVNPPKRYISNLTSAWVHLRHLISKARHQRRDDMLPVSEPKCVKELDTFSTQASVMRSTASPGVNYRTLRMISSPGNDDRNVLCEHKRMERQSKNPSPDSTRSEQEEPNNTRRRPNHTDSGAKGNGHAQLLLTYGGKYIGQPGPTSASLDSPRAIIETQNDVARDTFVVNKLQQTFQQRRNERSRGHSQHSRIRHTSLAPRSTQSTRRGFFTQDRLSLGGKTASRPNSSAPRRTSSEDSNGSEPDRTSLHSGDSGRMAKRRRRPYRRFSTSISGGYSSTSLSSSPNNIACIKERRKKYFNKSRSRKGSEYYQKDDRIRRGRRRNSSSARDEAALDCSSPVASDHAPVRAHRTNYKRRQSGQSTKLSDAKKVRLLLPETHEVEPAPWALVSRHRSNPVSKEVKSVLREPREQFPEDPEFIRPCIDAAKEPRKKGIPPNARWTKIDRRLVNPEALDHGRERYEERQDYVIVLRVLTIEEIEQYAIRTYEIRKARTQSQDVYYGESVENEYPVQRQSADSSERTSPPTENTAVSTETWNMIDNTMDESDTSQTSFERERRPDSDHDSFDSESHSLRREVFKSPTRTYEKLRQHSADTDQASMASGSLIDWNKQWDERSKNGTIDLDVQSRTEDGSKSVASDEGSVYFDRPTSGSPVLNANKDRTTAREKSFPLRQPSLMDDSVLTYDEEILFLRSDNILKQLKHCTERCKDVITTLQFVTSVQPDLGEVNLICKASRDCNTTLKDLLMTVEPLRDNKKVAEIIVTDLDILLCGLQASLDVLRRDFDLFDITPMTSDSREQSWRLMVEAFEKSHSCSMLENLVLVQRFGIEMESNINLGISKSSLGTHIKGKLARVSGYKGFLSAPSLSASASFRHSSKFGHSSKSSVFRSPSRYMQSPSRLSVNGSPMGHPRYFSRHRWQQEHPTMQEPITSSDLIYETRSNRLTSDDQSDSTECTLTSRGSNITGEVSWFWMSQIDVLPGFFATPWQSRFSGATCIGAITVLLRTIESFTSKSNFRYVAGKDHCKRWLCSGKTTYPSYAHNANGGVVVAGTYEQTTFDAFEEVMAPLELLDSYEFQVNRKYYPSAQAVVDSLVEIMGLDTWLSICGRLPQIVDSPNHLLQRLPSLVQQIMTDFDLEFSSVDRKSRSGVIRIIKTISHSLLQYLKQLNLSGAEQLFSLVALLRTVKMALCVVRGTDTAKLRDVLVHDVQIYLA